MHCLCWCRFQPSLQKDRIQKVRMNSIPGSTRASKCGLLLLAVRWGDRLDKIRPDYTCGQETIKAFFRAKIGLKVYTIQVHERTELFTAVFVQDSLVGS